MKTSFMRFRVVFAMFSALFSISAFLFPRYIQADDEMTYEVLKRTIEEGTGELEININNNIDLKGRITIPKTSGLTKLTIIGDEKSEGKYIIDGKTEYPFLRIEKGGLTVEINNLIIQNCKASDPDWDGAVINSHNQNIRTIIMLENSIFNKNHAEGGEGGVIFLGNGELYIKDCEFNENFADGYSGNGGAICQYSGSMDIRNSIFYNNKSVGEDEESDGGAITQGMNCQLTITKTNFIDNKAASQGGAIFQSAYSTLTIDLPGDSSDPTNSTDPYLSHFTSNTAKEGIGGAISTKAKVLRIYNAEFRKNHIDSVEYWGGAIYADSWDANPDEVIYEIKECSFEENKALYGYGGAISCNSKLTVEDSKFKNNSALYGGALYNESEGNTTIDNNSEFTGNNALIGGVFVNYGKLTVSYSKFTQNYANQNEAIFYSGQDGEVSFTNNTFIGNTVKNDTGTGWVFTLRGTNTISTNEFHANTDTERDMLFSDPYEDDPADTVSRNIYRGNYLEDKFSSPKSGDEIKYSEDIEVKLELREVYADTVRDGNVKITINGTPYPETFAVENGTAHLKIKRSALKDGTNEITAEYVSDECVSDECKQGGYVIGYYHYQQPEKLTFTIRKTTVIYTVTVIDDGNGTASAEPASGEEGDTVTLTAKPKEGYKFKEWQIVESGGGSLDGNIFTIGAGNAEIRAVFEKSEGPQPPVPPKPEPDWPQFFRLNDELPKTGITGTGIVTAEKPASVNYKPVNMELQIPGLNVFSEIVTVPVTDEGYAVAWLGNDAGLLEGFALPGEGISVIAGHNTLNAEEFGPFAAIGQLDEGERFFVMNTKGKLMTYEVYANEKIGSHDTEALRKAALVYDNTLTLLTCEDELPEGGYASRRIVSAKYIN